MFNSEKSTKPLLLAHRGSRLLAPENTSIAFDLALAHGSDALEIDIRLSKDQQIIVTHDADLDRTSDGRGAVRDHNLVDIKRLDAGYRFVDLDGKHHRGSGARFTTLHELVQMYPTTYINIDIKDNDGMAAQALAKVLFDADCANRVNVGSFHAAVIAQFRQLAPTISTAATQSEVAKLYAASCLRSSQPIQNPAYRVLQIPRYYRGLPLATQRFIDYLHHNSLPVMYWTINDPKTMRRLLDSGADGIVTDRTDLAQKVFTEMNLA